MRVRPADGHIVLCVQIAKPRLQPHMTFTVPHSSMAGTDKVLLEDPCGLMILHTLDALGMFPCICQECQIASHAGAKLRQMAIK